MSKINWISTVVGSFPYANTPQNLEQAFWDEINSGVDIPCYPQLEDMVHQFLDPLSAKNAGLEKVDKLYKIENEFRPPTQAFALEYGQFVLDFLKKHPETKDKIKGWKACLTGPFTLAGDILVSAQMAGNQSPIIYQEPRAIMSREILEKLAEMMATIAKAYNEMGATIISMDEPTLALLVGKRKTLFHNEDTIIEILNKAIKPIEKYSSIHICGRIAPKLCDILLSSNVKIMDHEFVNGSNEGVFEKRMFEREDKTLAYGAIQSSVPFQKEGSLEKYVETEAVMTARLQKAMNEFGAENIILKPDCGFGGLLASFGPELAPEIVRRKLKLLSETMKKVKP